MLLCFSSPRKVCLGQTLLFCINELESPKPLTLLKITNPIIRLENLLRWIITCFHFVLYFPHNWTFFSYAAGETFHSGKQDFPPGICSVWVTTKESVWTAAPSCPLWHLWTLYLWSSSGNEMLTWLKRIKQVILLFLSDFALQCFHLVSLCMPYPGKVKQG